MNTLIDQLMVFLLSLTLYLFNIGNIYFIIPVLTVIIISAFISCFEDDRITISLFFIYILVCLLIPEFIFFIPLISYQTAQLQKKFMWIISLLLLFISPIHNPIFNKFLIAVFTMTAYFLKQRTSSLKNAKNKYQKLRDNTMEISLQLEKQNKELLDKQDYEVNLATITERNRIARDIHDNVGHLLSRSILQIGALLAIDNNEKTKKKLVLIKNTLSEAMDSIRASVHNLHEESIDLQTEIHKLVENFSYCSIIIDYGVESNPEKDIKYCFIAIIKEALSNIIKHSNADSVRIIVREHPGFYQLIIHDNGTIINYEPDNGIGIKNIEERITTLNGNVNFDTENGFRIFISIPKK